MLSPAAVARSLISAFRAPVPSSRHLLTRRTAPFPVTRGIFPSSSLVRSYSWTTDRHKAFAEPPSPGWAGLSRAFRTSPLNQSAAPSFSYSISAAFSAKYEKLDVERNLFSLGPIAPAPKLVEDTQLPIKRPMNKRPHSGQDAFFASYINRTEGIALGVADGVGGWTDQGVDPAEFSHSLCEYMAHEASTFEKNSQRGSLKPRRLLEKGFGQVLEDQDIQAGGSTACIGVAEPNGQLEVAK